MTTAVNASAGLPTAAQAAHAVPTASFRRSVRVLPSREPGNTSALSMSPHRTPSRLTTPLHAAIPLRYATPLCSAPSPRLSSAKLCSTKVPRTRTERPPRRESTAQRLKTTEEASLQCTTLHCESSDSSPLLRGSSTSTAFAPKIPDWDWR